MIRDNDNEMRTRMLPLEAGVPYRTRSGQRVVLRRSAWGYMLMWEDQMLYHQDHGYVHTDGLHPLDIVDYHIEAGIWELMNGDKVELRPNPSGGVSDPAGYPWFGYTPNTDFFTASYDPEGYYYNRNTPRLVDICSYIGRALPRPIKYPPLNIPRYHNHPNQVHNLPHQTYNSMTNPFEYIERHVDRKISSGEYTDVPTGFPIKPGTGAHMSTVNPELLAYFPTKRHIERLVPQQIKAGRYLRQYFPEMHDDQVRKLSALCAGGDLKFFTKWQDMLAIYQQLSDDGIVSSCMSYDKWGAMHPLMVYHESDVELAVLYIDDKPVARALYNKHNKHFPMVYGQWEKMETAMCRAGFKHDSLCGSKIKKLPRYVSVNRDWIDQNGLDDIWEHATNETVLMPYIDHKRDLDRSHNCSTSVDVLDGYVRITVDGTFEANDHENAQIGGELFTCECCGERVEYDTTNRVEDDDIRVCGHCWDNHVVQVYTQPYRSFDTMEETALNNYIYIDDTWFEDKGAAEECGWVWSEFADTFIRKADALWVIDDRDWYPDEELGSTVIYDEDANEYVTRETFEVRIAERVEDQEQAA